MTPAVAGVSLLWHRSVCPGDNGSSGRNCGLAGHGACPGHAPVACGQVASAEWRGAHCLARRCADTAQPLTLKPLSVDGPCCAAGRDIPFPAVMGSVSIVDLASCRHVRLITDHTGRDGC